MDDSSIDQIMSSVFGDCSQQGLSPAHTQEPHFLDRVPFLFDESNDLISFLDNFEIGLAIEQQEAPMDLTMPRMEKKFIGRVSTSNHYCVWKSGSVAGSSHVLRARLILIPSFLIQLWCAYSSVVWKTVIVFTSHLDLTCDKGFELRFFQVGRPPSHRVWEAYQPQTTDAYILDFTDCTRVADVYVKRLAWLDNWKKHRDDNVPWCMVGVQPWKRTLQKHVQHSHEKALANGMSYDVSRLEHIKSEQLAAKNHSDV
ncbi:hypothetical protein TNCV_7581 [Trichonephila clavipes]|nr:hypothetical protein TNCV_7581 [Trichonephila clavipes]